MSEIIFDGSDPNDTQAREADEARLVQLGDKLQSEQEQAQEETYDRARKDSEQDLNYAGKFKSAEDLEKAYLELQKKLGQKDPDDVTEEDSTEESN